MDAAYFDDLAGRLYGLLIGLSDRLQGGAGTAAAPLHRRRRVRTGPGRDRRRHRPGHHRHHRLETRRHARADRPDEARRYRVPRPRILPAGNLNSACAPPATPTLALPAQAPYEDTLCIKTTCSQNHLTFEQVLEVELRVLLNCTVLHTFRVGAVFYPIFYPRTQNAGPETVIDLVKTLNLHNRQECASSLPSWLRRVDSGRLPAGVAPAGSEQGGRGVWFPWSRNPVYSSLTMAIQLLGSWGRMPFRVGAVFPVLGLWLLGPLARRVPGWRACRGVLRIW
jgi:hypothetical protein